MSLLFSGFLFLLHVEHNHGRQEKGRKYVLVTEVLTSSTTPLDWLFFLLGLWFTDVYFIPYRKLYEHEGENEKSGRKSWGNTTRNNEYMIDNEARKVKEKMKGGKKGKEKQETRWERWRNEWKNKRIKKRGKCLEVCRFLSMSFPLQSISSPPQISILLFFFFFCSCCYLTLSKTQGRWERRRNKKINMF